MTDPTTVPRTDAGRLEILATRPPYWEFLLYFSCLALGIERLEAKYRDYQLGYAATVGPRIDESEFLSEMSDRMSAMVAIISNIDQVASQSAQEAAFGKPGEPGNAQLIEHLAGRLVHVYERLLDWTQELRSLRIPERGIRYREILVESARQPIRRFREIVVEGIRGLEDGIATQLTNPDAPIVVTLLLNIELPEGWDTSMEAERKRFVRHG